MTQLLPALAPAALVAILAACAPGKPEAALPPGAEEDCGAGKLSSFVNGPASSEVLAQIRAAVGHDRIRVIRPGDAVTMDYRPDRLNLDLGEDGRIQRLRCG